MSPRRFQLSIRSAPWLFVFVAGISAFLFSFGTHLLWFPTHVATKYVQQQTFARFVEEGPSIATVDTNKYTPCQFDGVQFHLPESMTTQISVKRGAGELWIVFSDATRQLSIQFPLYDDKASPNSLRLTLLPVPQDIGSCTTPRLMKEVCDCSSDDLSWKQSKRDLHLHQWAITQRKTQGLDKNNMKYYSFYTNRDCEWILISCDPATVDRKERLRSVMLWETHDRRMSGQVHFGDSVRQKVPWFDTAARSFQLTRPLRTDKLVSDIAGKTDSEIISMIRIGHDSAEEGPKRRPSSNVP